MWRKVWFQIHWLIGITAGIVLAVVGATGALLSFEEPILRLLNAHLMTVDAAGRARLPLSELVAAAQAAHPDKRLASATVSAEANDTVRLTFVDDSISAAPGGRRGAPRWIDPYSGVSLGSERRGEEAFHIVEDVHRKLAAGPVGKAIVGVSTLLLLVMAGTGLYLRWPRFAASLHAWFTFRLAMKGRAFLWHLHAVVGTWVLLFYLLAALTGLYWSFEWYRDGLFAITGAPRPAGPAGVTAPKAPGRDAGGAALQRAQAPQRSGDAWAQPQRQSDSARPEPLQLANAWLSFERVAPAFETATLTLPRAADQPVELRYLDRDAPHERAYNRMTMDAASATVLTHERYDQKPLGHRLMGSMFVLHSGSFFGWPGLVLMMLASLAMPLFAVTGWMLYLERRRRKVAARSRSEVAGAAGIEPATR